MRRHLSILIAVGLVFIATTAGYVAFLSGNASGRAGTPTATKELPPRRTLPVARSARAVPLEPTAPSGQEGAGEPDSRTPASATVGLGDPTASLLPSVFAVSTTERVGWSRGGSPSASAPGVSAFGGPSPSPQMASTRGETPQLFQGGDNELNDIFRAPASAGSGSSPLPEPAAPLTFAVNALVVTALLRKRSRRQPG